MATTAAAAAPPPQHNVRPTPNEVQGSKRAKAKKPGQDQNEKLVNEKLAALELKNADEQKAKDERGTYTALSMGLFEGSALAR